MNGQRKSSKPCWHVLENEDGLILGVVLLILVIMTLMGISAVSNTNMEVQIAANDQLHKIAFYNAESGIYGTTKLISKTYDTMAEPVVGSDTDSIAPGIDYLSDDGTYIDDTFFRQVFGYDAYDGGTRDVTLEPGGISAEVDVERLRQQYLVGGGTEFASGSEGVGAGSTGGIAVFYGIDAEGSGPKNSASNLSVEYRKVVNLSGGL